MKMVTMEVTLVQGVARANKGNIVCHVWIIPGSQIRYLCTNYQSFLWYPHLVFISGHKSLLSYIPIEKGNYCSLYSYFLTWSWHTVLIHNYLVQKVKMLSFKFRLQCKNMINEVRRIVTGIQLRKTRIVCKRFEDRDCIVRLWGK